MQDDNGKGIQCPKCKSWFTYIRLKTGDLICRKCGSVTTKDVIDITKVGDKNG